MPIHKNPSAVITTFLSLALILIAWLALAPTQLGGQVSYVIVDGNSMETGFHRGDLVLVRKALTYQIGDAVTYQNAELGRYVFHRIASLNVDRFVLKGDHNNWFDSYQPTQAEIVGKLWVHIPKLGKAIEWLHLPLHLAIAIGLLGGILMSNMLIQSPKHEKSENKSLPNLGSTQEAVLYAFGFLALAFLGLGMFAFTRPLTRPADNITYQQDGIFFYSATGTPQIYDTTTVRSGEPVFPKLTCFLNLGFGYTLTGSQLQEVAGKQQLFARVMDEQSGWQRTIPMVTETAFIGNSYLSTATLDLCQVESLIALVEQETGLHQNTYTLKIISQVAVMAKSEGVEIQDSFEPSLSFKFDEVHFYLAADNSQNDPLHATKQSSISSSNTQANTLSLLGWKPSVKSARADAMIGLGLALGGLFCVIWLTYNTAQQSQLALIQLQYGALIMDVNGQDVESSSPTIDVNKIDDLARIAERQNTMILHMTINATDHYLVHGKGTTYRYILGNEKTNLVKGTEAPRQDVRTYMSSNHAAKIIPAEISREESFTEPVYMEKQLTPIAKSTEKVLMNYSLNIGKHRS